MIVTTDILRNTYRDYKNVIDKIKRDVDRGVLIRLNRGLYETDRHVDLYLLAEAILSPSYISFEWALSYYGLIPERVMTITSASLNMHKTKIFRNQFGRFTYRDINENVFYEGQLDISDNKNYHARIASKEKAICDSLSKWRVVHSLKELKILMFDDMRIDLEEFSYCDPKELIRLASLYKKTNLKLLIKLIEKNNLKLQHE